MKIKNLSMISYILIALSIIVLAFSFFAPIIFTGNSSSERWNFLETGQIGDTIGGIMNPFVAMAGVFSTFLAFLVQVRANKIQRKQFQKTLKRELKREKQNSFDHLKVLTNDIGCCLTDIKENMDSITQYINDKETNAFDTHKLRRTPFGVYNRIKELDRKLTFKGFQWFVAEKNKDWIEKYNQLYYCIDYISEGLRNIYQIADYHDNDIYEDERKIRNGLIELDNKCVKYLLDIQQLSYNTNLYHDIKYLHEKYINITYEQNDSQWKKIKELLTEFVNQANNHLSGENVETLNYLTNEILYQVQDIVIAINYIDQKSKDLIHELNMYQNSMIDKENSSNKKLENIYIILKETLETYKSTE